MNGTQHNEIKNETDVNERFFFFLMSLLDQQIQ